MADPNQPFAWGALDAVLRAAQLIGIIVSSVVAWGFATGRWAQKRESSEETSKDKIWMLRADLQREHDVRRDIGLQVGKLDLRLVKVETEIKDLERRVDVLERRRERALARPEEDQ